MKPTVKQIARILTTTFLFLCTHCFARSLSIPSLARPLLELQTFDLALKLAACISHQSPRTQWS